MMTCRSLACKSGTKMMRLRNLWSLRRKSGAGRVRLRNLWRCGARRCVRQCGVWCAQRGMR
eukprot:3333969-Pleurochrysis_carterae.AAC.3